jgi:ribosomal protein S18 acetylase RimI-like enzyme
MATLTPLRIARADAAHLQDITDLARKWQIGDRASTEISSQGFLMAGWQLQDYQRFLDEAEHFLVAIDGADVAGFSIAYSHQHAHFDPRIHSEIAQHLDEYVYYEQLCIAPEWAHRGVGSSLMSRTLQSSSPLPVVDEIAREPLNEASVSLHIKFGFKPLADITRADGIVSTIWVLER